MRKTELVCIKDLKIGDHFIYQEQENILCNICGHINVSADYINNCVVAYNINRNIVVIFNLGVEVLKIL